jgi:hypothetical protein
MRSARPTNRAARDRSAIRSSSHLSFSSIESEFGRSLVETFRRETEKEKPVKDIKIGIVTRVIAIALVVAGGVGTAAAQTAPVDTQALKAEVNAFMDLYWQLWSAGKIDDLVERIYHPMGQLSNAGHASIDQLKQRFPASRKAMTDKGYGRSQMPVRNVCVLAPTVAIVSGRGVRYLTDGSEMAAFGWTYTLIKGQAGWRMTAIFTHDPGRPLTCSS